MNPWWYLVIHFGMALPATRWYYGFLRERSAQKQTYVHYCKEHGDSSHECCFHNPKNFRPWPDYACATLAIAIGILFWPLIPMVALVMLWPRETSLEAKERHEALVRRVAELEAEQLAQDS